jgi:hypothetical protein
MGMWREVINPRCPRRTAQSAGGPALDSGLHSCANDDLFILIFIIFLSLSSTGPFIDCSTFASGARRDLIRFSPSGNHTDPTKNENFFYLIFHGGVFPRKKLRRPMGDRF